MEKLDDICAYKVQAMRTQFPTKELEHCRICSGYDEYCQNFIQIRKTEIPLRQGKFAVLEDGIWK
jgi:hypothetical protein